MSTTTARRIAREALAPLCALRVAGRQFGAAIRDLFTALAADRGAAVLLALAWTAFAVLVWATG